MFLLSSDNQPCASLKKNGLMPDVARATVLALANLHVEYLFIKMTERNDCIFRKPAVDGHSIRKTRAI